jgi:BASS family bile acid:Na+ symporter
MTEALLVALKLSVVALVLAIGLGATPSHLAYLWRRPALLARSLLAMYVVVPLAALAVVKTLPLPVGVKTAALVLAISAGAPLLPRKLMKLGREAYVFGLVVTSSLLAVAAVPAWLTILGPLFGREVSVDPRAVGLLVAKAFLGPLLLGMLLRWPLAAAADRLSERILGAAGAVLALSGAALLLLHGRLLLGVGWMPLLAIAGMTAVALAIGHALGGPDPDDRTALAVSCATRHVGIAMLVASSVPGPRTAAFVIAFVLASVVVSIPYLKWRARGSGAAARGGSGRAEGPASQTAG